MTWFHVCDTMHSHPKARRAGLAAVGLWSVAGSWSAQTLQEGFVPRWFVDSWPSGRRLADRLVAAALWEPAEMGGEEGWRFHDWTGNGNPTAEEEKDRKAKNRDRQRRARQSRTTSQGSSRVTDDVTHASPYLTPTYVTTTSGGDLAEVDARDPEPPACPKHKGLPRELIPDCRACGQRRQQWESTRTADEVFHRPPWCGDCDPHTRLRELAADDRADVVEQCPACHPLAVSA